MLLFTVYKDMSEAVKKHPEADILVNFASLRSAYDATMDALTYKKVPVALIDKQLVLRSTANVYNGLCVKLYSFHFLCIQNPLAIDRLSASSYPNCPSCVVPYHLHYSRGHSRKYDKEAQQACQGDECFHYWSCHGEICL